MAKPASTAVILVKLYTLVVLGERRLDIWSSPEVTVEFDYRITEANEAGVGYEGRMTVKMNGQQASFDIKGGSGC